MGRAGYSIIYKQYSFLRIKYGSEIVNAVASRT